jgi:multidrug efflux pump subunit AcrA (membrane-fusion protein)
VTRSLARTLIACGVALIVVLAIVTALAWPRQPAIAARIVKARDTSYEVLIPANGTLERANVEVIPAPVNGNLVRFAVQPGDRVRAGALLATLVAHGAEVAIRAPFAGTVQMLATTPGSSDETLPPGAFVTAGAQLASIARGAGFVVRMDIDEEDVPRVHPGQQARISSDDFAGRVLNGRLLSVAAVVQRGTAPSEVERRVATTVAVEETLPFLRDGMRVDVDIIVSRTGHVMSVDPAALRHDDDGTSYVYVLDAGHARRTVVALGALSATSAVIRSGLHDGEEVVASRDPAIVDGTRIRRERR